VRIFLDLHEYGDKHWASGAMHTEPQ